MPPQRLSGSLFCGDAAGYCGLGGPFQLTGFYTICDWYEAPATMPWTRGTQQLHIASEQNMSLLSDARPESERIQFLLRRDGYEASRAWVECTLNTYREALERRGSYVADATYRPLFEKSVREFQEWLISSSSRV